VKVLVGPGARSEFEATGFKTVLLELAISSGFPDLSPYVFRHILGHPPADFWDLIRQLRPVITVQSGLSNPVRDQMDSVEAARWSALVDALLSLKSSFDVTYESVVAWAPLAQRFSFAGPSGAER
jgi:hypothetical protein